MSRNSYALKVLQRIRDEAHRFAITFHRDLRRKRQTDSTLLKIRGVGEKKAKAMYAKFRTLDNMKKASLEDIERVEGMDKPTAIKIFEYFHNQ